MLIQVFWNRAIEINSLNNSNKTVFVPFSSDSIIDVYNKYINKIDESNSLLIKGTVENIGGIENSYYESVRRVFSDNNGSTYSFLRFSFFVLCAFEMETSNGYWDLFDKILKEKTTLKLNISDRTPLLDAIIKNLKSFCNNSEQIKKYNLSNDTEFLDLNVYGEDAHRKNVGRIYAHSIFNNTTIFSVKKALYELGFAYTIPFDSLTDDNFIEILEATDLSRIKRLYNNDSTKELIRECLKLWLINWEASEEEEIKLIKSRNHTIQGKINISRIWIDEKNGQNKIKWEYGFISPIKFGSEGKFYIDQEKEIYIDLDNSFNINDNLNLYIINNYADKGNFSLVIDSLNISFKHPKNYETLNSFGLKLVSSPNYFRNYFLQIDYEKIAFSTEKIFLASSTQISELNNSNYLLGNFETPDNSKYSFYRIRDTFITNTLSFIKTNNEIDFIITGSKAGKSTFTTSYPLFLEYGNSCEGYIEILNSEGQIIYTKDLSLQPASIDFIELGLMPQGDYKIKLKNKLGNYEIFRSTKDYEPFKITANGIGDRRIAKIDIPEGSFKFDEIKSVIDLQLLNPNWIIIYGNDKSKGYINTNKLNHELFDFYFTKNDLSNWFIQPNKTLFFAAFIESNLLLKSYHQYPSIDDDYIYLDTDLNHYAFKARAIQRGEVSININPEFYISGLKKPTVLVNYFSFELIEMDKNLIEKYGEELIGKKVYIISNFKEANAPDKLMKVITQECFPFKFYSL